MNETTLETRIAENLAAVQCEMDAAVQRSGRHVGAVQLVAVTKSAAVEAIQALSRLGIRDFAESRPQALMERAPQIVAPVRWHFIGHLQRNKARKLLPLLERIHSIDSFRLLKMLDELAGELGLTLRGMLEVNVSGEASKGGFLPAELEQSLEPVIGCRNLIIDGLMTMAPLTDEEAVLRQTFRGLRQLRDKLLQPILDAGGQPLIELSMGMSGDFAIAIEEGATLVRVGSRLFEGVE